MVTGRSCTCPSDADFEPFAKTYSWLFGYRWVTPRRRTRSRLAMLMTNPPSSTPSISNDPTIMWVRGAPLSMDVARSTLRTDGWFFFLLVRLGFVKARLTSDQKLGDMSASWARDTGNTGAFTSWGMETASLARRIGTVGSLILTGTIGWVSFFSFDFLGALIGRTFGASSISSSLVDVMTSSIRIRFSCFEVSPFVASFDSLVANTSLVLSTRRAALVLGLSWFGWLRRLFGQSKKECCPSWPLQILHGCRHERALWSGDRQLKQEQLIDASFVGQGWDGKWVRNSQRGSNGLESMGLNVCLVLVDLKFI